MRNTEYALSRADIPPHINIKEKLMVERGNLPLRQKICDMSQSAVIKSKFYPIAVDVYLYSILCIVAVGDVAMDYVAVGGVELHKVLLQ